MKKNRPEKEDDDDSDPDSKAYKYSKENIEKNNATRQALEDSQNAIKNGQIQPISAEEERKRMQAQQRESFSKLKMRDTKFVSKKEERHFKQLEKELEGP